MPLGNLSLAITTGSPGQPFEATILGMTTGRIEIGVDATPGFQFLTTGRIYHQALPVGQSTISLIEFDPGAAVPRRETRIAISADALRQALDGSFVTIPDPIVAAGSTPILRMTPGAALSLVSNPDGAWSITGNVLSWTSAAVGKSGRPAIAETLTQTVTRQRQTQV